MMRVVLSGPGLSSITQLARVESSTPTTCPAPTTCVDIYRYLRSYNITVDISVYNSVYNSVDISVDIVATTS